MSVLSGAVETAPVSDLHARGSVDPADFAVPGGREEEWRFTPLRRLRGLHKDAPLTQSGVTVAVEAAPELLVEKVKKTDDVERTGVTAAGAFLPTDRVSARAYAAVTEATVITVPKDTTASGPTYVRVTGTDATARPPATWSSTCSPTGAPPSSSTSGARPPTPTTSRSTSATAAT